MSHWLHCFILFPGSRGFTSAVPPHRGERRRMESVSPGHTRIQAGKDMATRRGADHWLCVCVCWDGLGCTYCKLEFLPGDLAHCDLRPSKEPEITKKKSKFSSIMNEYKLPIAFQFDINHFKHSSVQPSVTKNDSAFILDDSAVHNLDPANAPCQCRMA